MAKYIFQMCMTFFVYIVILFFTPYSFSQWAEAPTQPIIVTHDPKPDPDYSVCSQTFGVCIDQPPSSTFLPDNCGWDAEYVTDFPAGQGDCWDTDPQVTESKMCWECHCPFGEIRVDGICVPDQGCSTGIQNFVTGACYVDGCPFGDGPAEICDPDPQCIESEYAVLVYDVNDLPSCICPVDTQWNTGNQRCQAQCPAGSVYDYETNTCSSVISECPYGEYLTADQQINGGAPFCTSFFKDSPSAHQCSQIDYRAHELFPTAPGYCEHENFLEPYPELPEGCIGWNTSLRERLVEEHNNKIACESCSGLIFVNRNTSTTAGGCSTYVWHSAVCATQYQLCMKAGNGNGNFWNADTGVCSDLEHINFMGIYAPDMTPYLPIELCPGTSSSSSSSSDSSGSSSSDSSGSSSSDSSGSSSSNSSGSSSSSSSSSGGGGSSGGSSSSEGSGECDPESSDYLDCISPNLNNFPEHTETESGATTFSAVNQNFINDINSSDVVLAFSNVTNLITVAEPACPVFQIDLTDTLIGTIISTDLHCDLMELIYSVLAVIFLIGWVFMGFRIFASA